MSIEMQGTNLALQICGKDPSQAIIIFASQAKGKFAVWN